MGYDSTLKIIDHTIHQWLVATIAFIPNMVMAIIVLLLCNFFTKTVRRIAWSIFNKAFPNHTTYLTAVNITVTFFLWFFAVFLALNILHLTSFLTHLLAGAGIVGIVAGFALNDVSSNAFAGLLIRTQRPFVVGDWVKIGDFFGVVEKIGLVGTNVKTYKGHLAYIPNQLMFSNSFLNYSTYGKVKVIIPIGVSYGDDLAHVEEVALATIEKLPMIIDSELRDFYFVNIGASTYNFEVRFWIKFHQHIDVLTAQSEAIKALKKAFERENISVAYNVMTLDFGVKGGVNLYDNPITITKDNIVKAITPKGAKEDEINNMPSQLPKADNNFEVPSPQATLPKEAIEQLKQGNLPPVDEAVAKANEEFLKNKIQGENK